jgi:hypothetical protein
VFWLYEEGKYFLYQGAHLAEIPGTQYRDMQTPYQYGGPLSNTCDAVFLKRAWMAYVEWCRENNVVVEFMRFHPLLQNECFYGGEVIPNRLTVWIDLTVSDLLASYETRARTTIRKAIKNGLTTEWYFGSERAAWFTQFYQATMREIGADKNYLFPESYFRRLLAWNQSRLAVCLYENQPVAASIFLMGPEIMEYHLSAADTTGKRFGSTNFLLHEAALLGQENHCRRLFLGGGTDRVADNSLLRFKAGFSPNRAEFKIGKCVHSVEVYSLLQQQFLTAYAVHPTRVLFYR